MPIFRSAPDLRGFGQPSTPDVLVLNGLPGRLLARLMPDLLPQPDEVPGLLDELVHHVAHLGETREAIFIRPVLEPQKRVPAANQDDPELKPQVPEAL